MTVDNKTTYADLARTFALLLEEHKWLESLTMSVSFEPRYGSIQINVQRDAVPPDAFRAACRVFGKQRGTTYSLEQFGSNTYKWLRGETIFHDTDIQFDVNSAFLCTPSEYSQPDPVVRDLDDDALASVQKRIDELQAQLDTGQSTFACLGRRPGRARRPRAAGRRAPRRPR